MTETTEVTRVTSEMMTTRILAVDYIRLNATVTVCNLTLDNGYSVRGESACVDPANYDQATGERLSYADAFRKLWRLFGFLLTEQRHVAAVTLRNAEAS